MRYRLGDAVKRFLEDRCADGAHLSNDLEPTGQTATSRDAGGHFIKEEKTVYQCDTVLAVKRFLEDVQPLDIFNGPTGDQKHAKGIGARQISNFLGKENWSDTVLAVKTFLEAGVRPLDTCLLKKFLEDNPEVVQRLDDNFLKTEVVRQLDNLLNNGLPDAYNFSTAH